MSAEAATPAAPARRVFRTFEYRGVELDKLLTLSEKQVYDMFNSRARRNRSRQVQVKHQILMKKVLKAKKEAVDGEKPATVNTHCRNKIITPQMIGSVIGIYNGKCFNAVEIKPEMIGHYLGEFSLTYTPVRHGRPGVGATHSSRFVPLKYRKQPFSFFFLFSHVCACNGVLWVVPRHSRVFPACAHLCSLFFFVV